MRRCHQCYSCRYFLCHYGPGKCQSNWNTISNYWNETRNLLQENHMESLHINFEVFQCDLHNLHIIFWNCSLFCNFFMASRFLILWKKANFERKFPFTKRITILHIRKYSPKLNYRFILEQANVSKTLHIVSNITVNQNHELTL